MKFIFAKNKQKRLLPFCVLRKKRGLRRKTANYAQARMRMIASAFCIECLLLFALYSWGTEGGLLGQVLSDVSSNSYEGQAAIHLEKEGVISGFPDGTFRGKQSVNRAEAAKFLLNAGGFNIVEMSNNGVFPDVKAGSWYELFVMNAVNLGLMEGYPDGTFGPEKNINRAEFLKMLSNAFDLFNNNLYHYQDVDEEQWFSKYVGSAEEYNLFLYDKENLNPGLSMSRYEVAWAVYQMIINESYSVVVKTPFDYQPVADARTPNPQDYDPATLHGAASESSSSTNSNTSTYNTSNMCSDSDKTVDYPNGLNYQKKGTAFNHLMPDGTNEFTDECVSQNQLFEYHCNENGYLQRSLVNCPISCKSGACYTGVSSSSFSSQSSIKYTSSKSSSSVSNSSLVSSNSSEKECTDSDVNDDFLDGRNPNTKGTVFGYVPDGRKLSFDDECMNMTFLREYTCGYNSLVNSEYITCVHGCSNGQCLPESISSSSEPAP